MKFFKFLFFCFLVIAFLGSARAQEVPQPVKNDTIILAQAYMNLYLTETYFDTLTRDRISKILFFEKDEIGKIEDSTFINKNNTLYYFTKALYFQNQSKLLFRTRREFNRNVLRRLKSIYDQAIHSYNSANIDQYQTFVKEKNNLYEMINFDSESNSKLRNGIYDLKNQFNSLFNEDIYPDFQRIFYKAQRSNQFEFDSLTYFTNLYDMPLGRDILDNQLEPENFYTNNSIPTYYRAENRLELISRYMQLKYLAIKETKIPRNFNTKILFKSYDDFMDRLELEDDEFIKKELNPTVCRQLLMQLRSKYSRSRFGQKDVEKSLPFIGGPATQGEKFYFFPNPAPIASASFIKSNFKPDLTTLNQVDLFFRSSLTNTDYKDQLHYYYDMDGFALTTSLEKFNIDGSKVPSNKRFVENLGGDGKFSYYEIFKSMFFDIESEYRMFAFVIASKPATMSNEVMTAGFAEEILKNSYDTLPDELKNKSLPSKVLSIFVYHFHQNDIGETVELDLSGKLSVNDHLKSAGLIQIIQ
jgi:L-rhamnose mutarotase